MFSIIEHNTHTLLIITNFLTINMDVKGMKAASAIEWWPKSFCMPVYDPKDSSKMISMDLMEHMSGKLQCDGRKHKVSNAAFHVVCHYQC